MQVWREETQDKINQLSTSSQEVLERLADYYITIGEMSDQQKVFLKSQEEILEIGSSVKAELEISHSKIQKIMSEHSEYFDIFFDKFSGKLLCLLK